jgi:hypothetical protein
MKNIPSYAWNKDFFLFLKFKPLCSLIPRSVQGIHPQKGNPTDSSPSASMEAVDNNRFLTVSQ